MKAHIKRDFSGAIDVFVSSDPDSLRPGARWFDQLMRNLQTCRVQILLLSPTALGRPWIHFEAGAGWALETVEQVPICHSGLSPSDLPMPLNQLQAGGLTPEFVEGLYRILSTAADQDVPSVDFEERATQLVAVASTLVAAPRSSSPGVGPPKRGVVAREAVLAKLRRLEQDQSRTAAILSLDLDETAAEAGLEREAVQDELALLLRLGYAEPYAETFGEPATEGPLG